MACTWLVRGLYVVCAWSGDGGPAMFRRFCGDSAVIFCTYPVRGLRVACAWLVRGLYVGDRLSGFLARRIRHAAGMRSACIRHAFGTRSARVWPARGLVDLLRDSSFLARSPRVARISVAIRGCGLQSRQRDSGPHSDPAVGRQWPGSGARQHGFCFSACQPIKKTHS